MICDRCHGEMKIRRATLTRPYNYLLSGLIEVSLSGIRIHYCPNCHVESPEIPQPLRLGELISCLLLREPGRLQGNELRYLRKSAGLSAKDFAEKILVTPSHLSRIENGHEELGPRLDKLARAVVAAERELDVLREVLLDNPATARHRVGFKCHRGTWTSYPTRRERDTAKAYAL